MDAAVNLHRALEIGRAQRGQFGVPSTVTSLPDQVELRHLDQAIANSVLVQDLTWIDGEAHLVVGNVRILLDRERVGRIASTLAAAAARVGAMG